MPPYGGPSQQVSVEEGPIVAPPILKSERWKKSELTNKSVEFTDLPLFDLRFDFYTWMLGGENGD